MNIYYKLDKIDVKLLYELSIDSSKSIKYYAQKARISRSVALYRLERMQKTEIIQKYQTLIDFSKTGKHYARFGIKLIHATPESTEKLISALKNYEGIVWLASTQGRYNFTITYLYEKALEVYSLSNYIKNIDGKNINKIDISLLEKLYICGNNFLEKEYIDYNLIDYTKGISNIDESEKAILNSLSNNSRTNIIDIAKYSKISTKTALTKKKNLEKNKTILKYTISINSLAFNKESYHVFWTFANQDVDEINRLKNYILTLKGTTFITQAIGIADLECDMLASNLRELYVLLNKIKSEFSKITLEFEVMLLLKAHTEF